jgi:hypothetical protein
VQQHVHGAVRVGQQPYILLGAGTSGRRLQDRPERGRQPSPQSGLLHVPATSGADAAIPHPALDALLPRVVVVRALPPHQQPLVGLHLQRGQLAVALAAPLGRELGLGELQARARRATVA